MFRFRYNEANSPDGKQRKDIDMKNMKRILAWIAIILLLSMYLLSFIFALIKSEFAGSLFRASLGCTILVPVFLYLFLITAKAVKPGKSPVIDAIIFDVGGVLLDYPWRECAEEADVSPECRKILLEQIVGTPLWNEFDFNNRPYDEIVEEFAGRFPEYSEEIRHYIYSMKDHVTPYWYTEDLLHALKRKGYRIYYLSNWSEYDHDCLEKKGVMNFTRHMDGGIWSFEVHVTKPDQKIYELLISKYRLNPERCVLIDDHPENIRGAKAAGMAGILFTDYNDMAGKLDSLGVKL